MKPFRDWRLVTKVACLSLIVALLPLLGVSYLSVVKFSEGLRESAEANLEEAVLHIIDLCRFSGGSGDPSLEKKVKEIRIGSTGYAYIMDRKGMLTVHPAKQGESIYDEKDTDGRFFIRKIIEEARALKAGETGTIRYPWMNPELGDTRPRHKILKFSFFSPNGWIVAAGSYEDEVFERVRETKTILGMGIVACLLLAVVMAIIFSRFVTRPLGRLREAVNTMSSMAAPGTVVSPGGDEIGALTRSFNRMARRIKSHTEELSQAVQMRTKKLEDSEKKARRFSNLLTSIFQSSIDGIATTDPKGWITFGNMAYCEILGLSRNELKKKHVAETYVLGLQEAKNIMRSLREKGTLMNHEMDMIGADGSPVSILLSASLLRDIKRNVTGTVGVFKNVSGRKILEEKLRETQVHLLRAEKMRALGDLLTGVAHEINNPLMASGAVLFTLMEEKGWAEKNIKGLTLIRECNERIKKIVDHLRKFTRDADTIVEVFPVSSPLEDAILIAAQQLANQGIEISKNIQQDLPPVEGNPGQLEQVFLNFIFNARDAMAGTDRKKMLIVSSGIHGTGSTEPEVEVSIEDTGKGIPRANLEKIFEPFFTTKQVGEGTGLGLSICFRIIADHKGRIEVDSRVGKGTRFTVILPAASAVPETRGEDHG